MQIRAAEVHRIRIPFKRPFGHSLAQRSHTEAIIVGLRGAGGTTGWGEVLPRPYLTGETLDAAGGEHLPALVRDWLGRRLDTRAQVIGALTEGLDRAGRRLATFCGFELALLDLAGKTLGFPAGEVLGPDVGPPLEAGVVIGFEVETEALPTHCALLRLAGRRHVKVKVGRDDDQRRVEIVRRSLGPAVPIRIDANGAWSAEQAIESLRRLVEAGGIESVEQPVPAEDLAGMRLVRERTGVPVMADESLCTVEDARRLIEMQAADIFNVRIGKCGGLLGSLRVVRLAAESGIDCHLGTLVGETGILSRAAEIFGRRVPGFACLEGKGQSANLLEEDLVEACTPATLGSPSGLGVKVLLDRLARRGVGEPKVVETTEIEG